MNVGSRTLPLLLLLGSLAATAHADSIEFLYVEPNTGGAAGGHVALRFGDRVYDFQNHALHTLRLRRAPYEYFRYVYSVLGNRTIHFARIEVSAETRSALLDRFNSRYLVEGKHFAVLDSLRNDDELLERIGGERERSVELQGAGFFFEEQGLPTPGESTILRTLRARVEAQYGVGFIEGRIQALESEIARLEPSHAMPIAPRASKHQLPASSYGFSDRFTDLSLEILALRALDDAPSLRRELMRTASDDDFALSSVLEHGLRTFARSLEKRVVALAGSARPDWGFPMLLAMARLQVIEASLDSGRLLVLDAFPSRARVLSASIARRNRPFLTELHLRARQRFLEARADLASGGAIDEQGFALLEDTANRTLEFREGIWQDRPVRVHSESLLPAPVAENHDLPFPRLAPKALRAAQSAAGAQERAYARELSRAFGYQLITRNCVTELFATIESEFDREESERRLGGYVSASLSLDFIPAVAFRTIVNGYSVTEVGEVPSYRRTRLEAMYARENDFKVFLRESNTLTSTVYRRNDRDPLFLFFTEDVPAIRPIFGVFNLAAGIGEMVFGVLKAPLDRGASLWSGIKGAAFSLPDLAFVNLRKGSLEYGRSDPPRTTRRVQSDEAR